MASPPRVLIVIGQVLADPWLSISLNGQFPTWLPTAEDLGIPVRHSHGKRPGRILRLLDRTHEWVRWRGVGKKIVPAVDVWVGARFLERVPDARVGQIEGTSGVAWAQNLRDVYALQRWKVLGSLRQALHEDFDFVYFTTASSYVRTDELMRVINRLPRLGTYAGTRHVDAQSGIEFASGANRILSRDVAESVLENRLMYRNDVMEDVGLGQLITRLGVQLMDLPSINVSSIGVLDQLTDEDIDRNFHFRMTSGTRRDRQDASLMHALHARVLTFECRRGDD